MVANWEQSRCRGYEGLYTNPTLSGVWIYMKRGQKVMLGLVGFVVVLGCVWTPVCKRLFPERVAAVNQRYKAVLAGQAGAKK